MNLLQEFTKINKQWPKKSLKVPYDDISKLENFELGYFTSSDVQFRCFSIKLNPADDHLKDVALLYNPSTKQFISLLNNPDGLVITLFENNEEEIEEHFATLHQKFSENKKNFSLKPLEIRDQIAKCILVERKVDEVMHLSMSSDLARRVYFAIGECRERAALVPIFQNSNGADLVQLALHKWMDYALNLPQEHPFPADNTKGLIKNFLQIKKWLKDLINKQLLGISTLKEEQQVE